MKHLLVGNNYLSLSDYLLLFLISYWTIFLNFRTICNFGCGMLIHHDLQRSFPEIWRRITSHCPRSWQGMEWSNIQVIIQRQSNKDSVGNEFQNWSERKVIREMRCCGANLCKCPFCLPPPPYRSGPEVHLTEMFLSRSFSTGVLNLLPKGR